MKRILVCVLLLLVVSIPTIYRGFRPGIFSMQDFPYFRLVEYSKCINSLVFPCRWAPDAGLGYGEPVFNFYSHVPFFLGSIFITLGLSAVNSLKLVFAVSLIGSAASMFFLAKKVWGSNLSGLISAVLYLYAPYRAVDTWVRGALPESFSFVFLPLILLFFEKYLEKGKKIWLLSFSASLSLLILTHNLSVVLYVPVIMSWVGLRLVQNNKIKLVPFILLSGIIAMFLSAFYLLPSIFESNLVNLKLTTVGYFDFRAHFVTLPQLFVSRFWGYGGSTWGSEDGLSLSVGQVQWISALIAFIVSSYFILVKKDNKKINIQAILLVCVGIFYLFLTHNKSAFLWEWMSSFMSYIQFPWRFLGPSVFAFAFAAGCLAISTSKTYKFIPILIMLAAVISNYQFFKQDIWYNLSDKELQNGEMWVEQTRASLSDYWPIFGPIPNDYIHVPDNIKILSKDAFSEKVSIIVPKEGDYSLPVTYFPGWAATVNGRSTLVGPDKNGFINIHIEEGENTVELRLHNTRVRSIGNFISFVSIISFVLAWVYITKYDKSTK